MNSESAYKMATEIFYSKDPPLPTHNDEPQVLGKLHKGRLLLERGVSHSQTALAINYRSVWSPKQSSYLVLGTT